MPAMRRMKIAFSASNSIRAPHRLYVMAFMVSSGRGSSAPGRGERRAHQHGILRELGGDVLGRALEAFEAVLDQAFGGESAAVAGGVDRCHNLALAVEDRHRERGDSIVELVDGDGVALAAHLVER